MLMLALLDFRLNGNAFPNVQSVLKDNRRAYRFDGVFYLLGANVRGHFLARVSFVLMFIDDRARTNCDVFIRSWARLSFLGLGG